MVKIDRTPTPPASLAIESRKVNGSYREPDVTDQLRIDFHGKCYICELGELTDIQVEHLRPHHSRAIRERVFDWNNLFYSCPHCNNLKKDSKYDDKILDCCAVDPERFLCHIFEEQSVSVKPADGITSEEAVMTAELIQNSFEKRNTGIRTIQCNVRFQKLAETMNDLFNTLEGYKKNPSSRKYSSALRAKLSRKYKFAAFTRYYVRSHIDDYPGLRELVL